jgi:hypothetical protein
MKKYLSKSVFPALFAFAVTMPTPAFCADAAATNDVSASSSSTNMEILRQKVKADKKLVVAANMNLTDAESKVFWPIYDAYQKDIETINQRMANAINDYAAAYKKDAVLNDAAQKLLDEAIAIEFDEVSLKKTYAAKLGKGLPAGKVARYLQIENKIRAIVRYHLAEAIPLVE